MRTDTPIIDEIISFSMHLHRETGVREEPEIELPKKTFLLALCEAEKNGCARVPQGYRCLRYPAPYVPLACVNDLSNVASTKATRVLNLSREVIETGFEVAAPCGWVIVRMKDADRADLLRQCDSLFRKP